VTKTGKRPLRAWCRGQCNARISRGGCYAKTLVLALPLFMHMGTYTRDGNCDCPEHRRRRVARVRLALRDSEFIPPRQEWLCVFIRFQMNSSATPPCSTQPLSTKVYLCPTLGSDTKCRASSPGLRGAESGTQRTEGACALNLHTIVPRVKGTSFHVQPLAALGVSLVSHSGMSVPISR
jgi:hypothetical protein